MRSSIDVALSFDVEDIFHGPAVGSDDVVRELADALSEVGAPATFFVIGRRARLLAERGRSDVIDAVRRHAVGSHTLTPAHPTMPEYCAGRSWSEGFALVRAQELEALEIVADVFRVEPCGLSQHWYNTAPQAHAVAAEVGKPFAYGLPAAPPLRGPTWYCGALNLPFENAGASFWVAEASYADDAAFEVVLRDLDAFVDRALDSGCSFVPIILCHPLMLRCLEWPEHLTFANGRNVPEAEWPRLPQPPLRSEAEVAHAVSNVRRLAARLAADERLRLRSYQEVAELYGQRAVTIDAAALAAAARRVVEQNAVVLDERFTPAELCVAFAESLLSFSASGALPGSVPRRSPLGPVEDPQLAPDVRELDWGDFVAALAPLLRLCERGHLPHGLHALGVPVGIGSFHRALAGAYLDAADGRTPERVPLLPFNRYPAEARELGHLYLDLPEELPEEPWGPGRLLAPGLDTGSLARLARLQTWTMCPASRT